MYFFFTTDSLADPPWSSSTLMLWSLIEPGVYLFAACLPACRPIVLYVLGLPNTFGHGSKRTPKFFGRGVDGDNVFNNVPLSEEGTVPESGSHVFKQHEENSRGSSTQGSFTRSTLVEGSDDKHPMSALSKEIWQG